MHVNLFLYNIPTSGIGLPPAELFWSNINVFSPETPLSHVIVGNQDLSQDDRTLRNVSLVVTTDQNSIADYRFFCIHFTFSAETSLIDWILLSEVQLCGEAGMCVCTLYTGADTGFVKGEGGGGGGGGGGANKLITLPKAVHRGT